MVYKRVAVDRAARTATLEKRPGGGLGKIEAFLNNFGLGPQPVVFQSNLNELRQLLSSEKAALRDHPLSENAKDSQLNIQMLDEVLAELDKG